MALYRFKDFPSVVSEIKFLQRSYGDRFGDLFKRKQLIPCESMDIIWAYEELPDEWAKSQYLYSKAGYLKTLRDYLSLFGLYKYYEDLAPFAFLDAAYDAGVVIRDVSTPSPIAWIDGSPVTALHTRLRQDAHGRFRAMPDRFGCLGYNFTKRSGAICMTDTCGLSLYKDAEFGFTQDGILLGVENVVLFDTARIEANLCEPFNKVGDVQALSRAATMVKESIPPIQRVDIDPSAIIYELFCKTQKEVLNPLVGNKPALQKVMNIFGVVA
jgi:hypothetical protein